MDKDLQPKNLVRCAFSYSCPKCKENVGVFIMADAGYSSHDSLCLCGHGITFRFFLDGQGRTELSKVTIEKEWTATLEQVEQAKNRVMMAARMKQAQTTIGDPFQLLHAAMKKGADTGKLKFKKHAEPAVIAMADALYREMKGNELPEPEMKRLAELIWNQAEQADQLRATVAFAMEGYKDAEIVLAGYRAHKEEGRWQSG